jgi:hypothetical protein
VVEVEPLPPPQNRPELLEEPGHRREPKLQVRERHLGRLGREHSQRRGQRLRILLREPTLATRRERRRP